MTTGVSYATRCFISAEPCSSNKIMNDKQQVEVDTKHHSLGFLDLDENGEVIFRKDDVTQELDKK